VHPRTPFLIHGPVTHYTYLRSPLEIGAALVNTTSSFPGPPAGALADASLAEALIFDRDRVLLIRRADVPVWTLPGGHRDPGETAEVSCVREVREETGLVVRVTQPLGYYRRPYWLSGGRAALYCCEPVEGGGTLAPGIYEEEARFWPVNDLPAPILYWYPPIIRAAYGAGTTAQGAPIDPDAVSPTLSGFLGSLLRTPRLWLPLARHAVGLHWTSRAAQRRARRRAAR